MMTDLQRVECEHCGYLNNAEAKICVRCSESLVVNPNIGTDIIGENPNLDERFRGGALQAKILFLHIHGDNQSIRLELQEGAVYEIGRRDPEKEYYPAIDLTDFQGKEKGVSRHHAELTYNNEVLRLIDQDSPNHTFLNDTKLVKFQQRILRDNDRVRFGHLMVTIQFA